MEKSVLSRAFKYVSPEYPEIGSVSLVLSGSVPYIGTYESGSVDTASVASTLYSVVGVGFIAEGSLRDTIHSVSELWIPILDKEGETHTIHVPVKERSVYSNWIYLWASSTKDFISGSWFVDDLQVAPDSYEKYNTGHETLEYSCTVQGPGNIIFVTYVPEGFEQRGEYNAILNNATTQSRTELFTVDSSSNTTVKHYISDEHKTNFVGGCYAGRLEVSQEGSSDQKTFDFFRGFEKQKLDDKYVQTLDLAFMNYRAISASVYVDRSFISGGVEQKQSVEEVWSDLQNGNVDEPETIYFSPRSYIREGLDPEKVKSTGWIDPPTGSYYRSASVVQEDRTSTPTLGSILFKVKDNITVRYVQSTIYAPFLNTVYRTDDFGVVSDMYPEPK